MRTDEQILIELGDRIRKARDVKGWSQADLASAMNTGTSQVSLLENGKREPGLFMLRRLVQVLGIKVVDLLNDL